MPRLILEGCLVFAVIYGLFWVFSKGTPDQNRKLLKLVGRLAVGGIIAVVITAAIVFGLIQLNHVFEG